jgi:hypothetical protein
MLTQLISPQVVNERQPSPIFTMLQSIYFDRHEIEFRVIAVPAPMPDQLNNTHFIVTGKCNGGFISIEPLITREEIIYPRKREIPDTLNVLSYYLLQALDLLMEVAAELGLTPEPHVFLTAFFRAIEIKGFPFHLEGLRDHYAAVIKRAWR